MNTVEKFRVNFEQTQQEKPEKKKEKLTAFGVLSDFLDSVKDAVIVVMIIFTFAVRMVGVEGGSMLPTYEDGDWVIVSAMTPGGVEHGDVVVAVQPWERNVPIIKRVIGVGGDTVDIDFSSGEVSVNGEILNEDYIAEATHLFYDVKFPVQVEEGKLFVMGDNRNNSIDSRSSQIGLIDERYILGKTLRTIYPIK
ncbi:MAG: signal peptidase I [Clostridia bacterium]|nr:signal peptidase I [Clostridia bacterium]